MAIDRIGCQDTGLGGIINASGFTGITLVVRKLTQFQRHGCGRLFLSSAECCRLAVSQSATRDGVNSYPFSGRMQNRLGNGWSLLDGYGFINAEAAVVALIQ